MCLTSLILTNDERATVVEFGGQSHKRRVLERYGTAGPSGGPIRRVDRFGEVLVASGELEMKPDKARDGAMTRGNDLAPPEELPETVIRPSRGWVALNLRDLWLYRELLYFLTWRDVMGRSP